MYNLEQLRMFVETAQLGSFSACARRLGKVQSAVSQGIANLEIELNTTLFDRTSRKPSLTAHGERLLPFAKGVLQQTYELDSVTLALNSSHETMIKIAVDDALLPLVTSVFDDFSNRFPATILELYAVATPDVLTLVHSGRADLGLMFASSDFSQAVDLGCIGSLPFSGVVSSTHPLATLDVVSVADLTPYRQLSIKGLEGEVLPHFPNISSHVWWGNSFNAVNAMVKDGLGWSYIPAHMADQYQQQGSMVRMNLSFDHKPWRVPVDRVMAKQSARGPALMWLADAFVNLLDD
ncbi:LysR family transcriptional regulator [Shewanella sp. UCD-KL21]|uniref:LysR family transcriptional regulator n=1 Tax=Shewanella sp. UCD-KL21 TaxID=1917164 RepID=UPI0009709A7D|nr:LysR family transcriptional regulator [Shewanella sp. UCD-KL21]